MLLLLSKQVLQECQALQEQLNFEVKVADLQQQLVQAQQLAEDAQHARDASVAEYSRQLQVCACGCADGRAQLCRPHLACCMLWGAGALGSSSILAIC